MSDDQGSNDDDRAAILARRRRYIATALTGMAAGALTACAKPCLRVDLPEPDESAQDDGDSVEEADPAAQETPPPPQDPKPESAATEPKR